METFFRGSEEMCGEGMRVEDGDGKILHRSIKVYWKKTRVVVVFLFLFVCVYLHGGKFRVFGK